MNEPTRNDRQIRAAIGTNPVLPVDRIERSIFLVRGRKIMLDADLATLYGVKTKDLNRAVRRNIWRFPSDFMFMLTKAEAGALRRQTGTLERGRGKHRKHPTLAFSEQGVAMLSSVLRSRRAIEVNIEIMRAFVRLSRFLATHQDLARKLDELERRHEHKFEIVFEAIRQLSIPDTPKRRKIGFETG